MESIFAMLIVIWVGLTLWKIWKYIIFPVIVTKTTQELEKNPKWITSELRHNYYGFSDIDIITAKSSIGTLPRFRLKEDKNKKKRLELLISEDTSTKEIDQVAKLALQGKLYVYYNLSFPNKSVNWLSTLLYMLDGNDVKIQIKKNGEIN